MSITERAIRNDRVTLVALGALLVAGMLSYTAMPRAMDPGFTIRTARVVTIFPGASPERVEQLVTDRIEQAVQEIPELDFVNSQSETGLSVVLVNIREEFMDMRPIFDDLRRKVEDVEGDLPDGVIGPMVNDEFGDVYGILLSVVAEGYSYPELREIGDEIRDEILRIPDVAKVEILGNQEERVFVEFDNAALSAAGLSPGMLRDILRNRNIITPGGNLEIGDERVALEPTGNFEDVDERCAGCSSCSCRTATTSWLPRAIVAEVRRGLRRPAGVHPCGPGRASGPWCLGVSMKPTAAT
jgi:multidrug efflux pump